MSSPGEATLSRADLAASLARLAVHAARLREWSLSRLNQHDPARATDLALRVGPLYGNFARQSYDRDALQALHALAGEAGFTAAMQRLTDGGVVNVTEHRAALHTALRGAVSSAPAARAAHVQAQQARVQMRAMVDALAQTQITDIVSVGIGGSDLGPRMVVDALSRPGDRFRVHFVSNVDGASAQRVLTRLDPTRTAAVLISKTFSTQETLLNGRIVRDWLGDDSRVYAVSANVERARAFGIDPARILPMWDWVGGRYSLWSTVGFPIALALGCDAFEALLAGASEMDTHALQVPTEANLVFMHALTALWNRNALGLPTQAVLPYDERLKLLPNYLQQLVMESLGKRVALDGAPVTLDTVPVWWGGPGTDTQHSFFQALHQGTQVVPADFIGVVHGDDPYPDNHAALLANLLAQTESLANGQASDDPHRIYPGGRPNSLILLNALTPQSLGMLIALYEHSVYLQSVAWGINAFDQFGVELGKQVANRLLPAVRGDGDADDVVTAAVLAELRAIPR